MTIAPGSHLGPYEITSQVGAGGMGVIYRARDTRLGREVAIKVLPPAFAEDAERLRRFEQEARTTSSLSHPNILSVFDTGVHEGSPYLVMELLDGANLRERMDGQALPLRKAVEIARSVAEALAAAHGKGIIHRDIKPENIFLTKDGRVKVLDFGLAKYRELVLGNNQSNLPTNAVVSGETGAGALLGTVGYMAPEQVNGGAVDARTDLFALGITLYEMVSGRRAFKGDSTIETLHAILKTEPPDFPPELKVSPVLERVIRRCLEKEPEARFQSARDLAFALEHLGSGSQTSGTGTSPMVRPLSKRARWVPLAAVGLGLVVLLAVGFLLGSRRSQGSNFKMESVLPSPMAVTSARFMPDGKQIVFSANTVDGEEELYLQAPGEPVPRLLGVKNARILAVSPRGEMALNWKTQGKYVFAVLGAPGLVPRIIHDQEVNAACWDEEGKELIIKFVEYEGQPTQAFVYKGKLLYRVPYGYGVGGFTLRPDGKGICFIEWLPGNPMITSVDFNGQVDFQRSVGNGAPSANVSVMRAGGRVIGLDAARNELVAFDDQGRRTSDLMALAGEASILDGLPDGSLLLSPIAREWPAFRIWWKQPTQPHPELVSSSGWGIPKLSKGGLILGTTQFVPEGEESWLFHKGSNAFTPIGMGMLHGLAEEGDRALVSRPSQEGGYGLWVTPTGSGKEVKVQGNWISISGHFFPNGEQALISGLAVGAPDVKQLSYILDTQSGELKPLPFKAVGPVSEDGKWAFSRPEGKSSTLYGRINLETGQRIPLPDSCRDRRPVEWVKSGQEIWTLLYTNPDRGEMLFPVELARVDLKTGRILSTELIKGPGVKGASLLVLSITRDGQSFAYTEGTPSQDQTRLYRLSPGKP